MRGSWKTTSGEERWGIDCATVDRDRHAGCAWGTHIKRGHCVRSVGRVWPGGRSATIDLCSYPHLPNTGNSSHCCEGRSPAGSGSCPHPLHTRSSSHLCSTHWSHSYVFCPATTDLPNKGHLCLGDSDSLTSKEQVCVCVCVCVFVCVCVSQRSKCVCACVKGHHFQRRRGGTGPWIL